MFGVMNVEFTKPEMDAMPMSNEMGFAIGFRNSHNKTMALSLTAGTRVFVCDNMAFNGEINVSHIHRPEMDSVRMIGDVLDRVKSRGMELHATMSAMTNIAVSIAQAALFFNRCVINDVIPANRLKPAVDWYMEQRQETNDDAQHMSRRLSLWYPYNAVTAQFKTCSAFTLSDRSRRLSRTVSEIVQYVNNDTK